MDTNFGVGISRYLFEQSGTFSTSDLENKILEQVSIYLPYITITDIAMPIQNEDNTISVQITYFIDGFTTNEELFLNLEKDGVTGGI